MKTKLLSLILLLCSFCCVSFGFDYTWLEEEIKTLELNLNSANAKKHTEAEKFFLRLLKDRQLELDFVKELSLSEEKNYRLNVYQKYKNFNNINKLISLSTACDNLIAKNYNKAIDILNDLIAETKESQSEDNSLFAQLSSSIDLFNYYSFLGNAYEGTNNPKNAFYAYNLALDNAKKIIKYEKGYSFLNRKNFISLLDDFAAMTLDNSMTSECIKLTDFAITLNYCPLDFYKARFIAFNRLGDTNGAMNTINKAISKYPRMASLYSVRAELNESIGNTGTAILDYKKAADLGDSSALFKANELRNSASIASTTKSQSLLSPMGGGSSSFRKLLPPSSKQREIMLKYNAGETLTDAEYKLISDRISVERSGVNVSESITTSYPKSYKSNEEIRLMQIQRKQKENEALLKKQEYENKRDINNIKKSLELNNIQMLYQSI